MFKFFTDKRWHLWSIGGTILILAATWYQVQLDVRINEWFGEFYDTLQKALTTPNSCHKEYFLVIIPKKNVGEHNFDFRYNVRLAYKYFFFLCACIYCV